MLNSKSGKVFKYQFKSIITTTAWYVAIYAAVLTVVSIIVAFQVTNISFISFHSASFIISSMIFMFVIGITTYISSVSKYISSGVTRKDFFKGSCFAVGCLSAILTAIVVILLLLELYGNPFSSDPFEPFFSYETTLEFGNMFLQAISAFIQLFGCFMAGWLIGNVFYGYGIARGLIAVGISTIMLNLITSGSISQLLESIIYLWGYRVTDYGSTVYYIQSVLVIIMIVVITVINYFLNKNVSIKISTGND